MKKVVVDFVNSININNCDIDDAFALFFLLSHKDVEVIGITTTFGNSTEDKTYDATIEMARDLNINIPIIKGEIFSSEAANFIKNTVDKEKVELISLGATTNTMKALALGMDPNKLNSFIQMGGITSPLEFKGQIMDELNLFIDFLASNYVLEKINKPIIITSNNCIDRKYKVKDSKYKSKYMNYLDKHIKRWAREFELIYKEKDLVIRDALTALYLTNPEFFIKEKRKVKLSENMMKRYLEEGDDKELILTKLRDEINAMDYIVR
ncbi:MAG: nucleoside hydrolase [Anaerococcus sp.]|nr:nucleoside hydrolase [Anaerococcus sp.]